MRRLFFLAACLAISACAGNPPAASPAALSLLPPMNPEIPLLSPAQIQEAEALRAEGMELLFSKDPQVKNPARAYEKFLAAASIGDPISMDQVGGFHAAGLAGVEKSCAKALEWFGKSAEAGYPMAMNNLAYTLVTCPEKKLRDTDRAESLMKFLLENSAGFLAWLDTYAAVLAAQGNFTQAVKTLDTIIDLAEFIESNPEQIDEMKLARTQYKKKKIYTPKN